MPEETPITSAVMARYNKLIDFAKQKGYAGNPALDHDENLRKKVFAEYNAANPNDAVPYELVRPIQNEIQNYRQTALSAIQRNKGSFDNGVTDKNFMAGISQVDGIFGQKTSQWKFPLAYVMDKAKNEKKLVGFAPKVDLLAALNK